MRAVPVQTRIRKLASAGALETRSTNAQAAARHGLAPILPNGSIATLHHAEQNATGPLFEASTRYHNISRAAKPPLHPYGKAQHPYNPMDESTRKAFQQVDSPEYWKKRGAEALAEADGNGTP